MEGKMEEFRFEKTSISSSSLSIYDKDGFRKRIFEEIASLRTSGKSVFQSITCVSKIYTVLGRGNTIPEPRKKKKKADLRAANSFHDKQQRHVAVLKIWYKYEQSCKPAKERLVKCAAARSITR